AGARLSARGWGRGQRNSCHSHCDPAYFACHVVLPTKLIPEFSASLRGYSQTGQSGREGFGKAVRFVQDVAERDG
ncbi:MAG: hypothetical protein QOG19_2444, partial [Mycobacterium sp.]|nr:hypothetical protein [Mycobacterium sp.]